MKSKQMQITRLLTLLLVLCLIPVPAMATQTPEKSILRIHGSDRFETAIKISHQVAENSDYVLLANGYNYPDALTGSSISGGKYPLLFTSGDNLNASTKAEIRRLNPQMVILLGGESSISSQIERELNLDYEVMRLGGADRYETMELIQEYSPKKNRILTSGENFADSLVAAPLALSKDANIVLTPKQTLTETTMKLIKNFDENLTIIGGDNAISASMRELIWEHIPRENTLELSGTNRYETSVRIAEQFLSDTVIVSSGEDFPDSLAGSVLAGSIGAPILLSGADKLDASVRDYLKANKDQIHHVILLGGEQTLSENVVDEVLSHISGVNYANPAEFSDKLLEFRRAKGNAPIYAEPNSNASAIDETYDGEYLQCYGDSGGYLKLRRGGGFVYMMMDQTTPIEDPNMFKVVGGLHILNKQYYVPSDYAPGLDPDAWAAFQSMQQACWAQNIGIYLESSYRSYWYQATIYNNYVAMDGYYADRYSAKPGNSEHQTGRAYDVSSYGEGLYQSFENTATFSWLRDNAASYGFILRYPHDKEHVTGYMYEPWHYTYVGVPLAQQIKDSGLSVEEYFGLQ
ncbi:MAG: cell wall-binding repeat-containing protein [Tissierellia bacterium]|nr:cell wall-binding repeat-containing protein [Tissierellia bacterium]